MAEKTLSLPDDIQNNVYGLTLALDQLNAPKTPIQKVLMRIVPSIPIPTVRNFLTRTPMGDLEATVTDNALTLYEDLAKLQRSGRITVVKHNRLRELLDLAEHSKVETEKTNAVAELRKLFDEEADKALNIRKDRETETFLVEVRSAEKPDVLLDYVRMTLSLSEPTIEALQLAMVAAAKRFEQVKNLAVVIKMLREPHDVLHANAKHVVDAAQLEINSLRTVSEQIKVSVQAAQLVYQLTQFAETFQSVTVPQEMQTVADEAKKMIELATVSGFLTAPENTDRE